MALAFRPKPKAALIDPIPDWRAEPKFAGLCQTITTCSEQAPQLEQAVRDAEAIRDAAQSDYAEARFWLEQQSPDASEALVAELRAKLDAAERTLAEAQAAAERNAATLAKSREHLAAAGLDAQRRLEPKLHARYIEQADRFLEAIRAARDEQERLAELWQAINEQFPLDRMLRYESALGCPYPPLVYELRDWRVDPLAGDNVLNAWARQYQAYRERHH